MWTSILNVAIQRYGNKALCFFLFSECRGMHRLNTSEVSPCGEASSRWWSEPCARCVNAVVVWIVIAALCVKLAQGRDRNSPPLTTLPQFESRCRFPREHNATYAAQQKKQWRRSFSVPYQYTLSPIKIETHTPLKCMHLCWQLLLRKSVFQHQGL